MEISLDYEDELDAAREAVRHAGGAKKVGPQMFPDKSVESAARYLMDALNPARAERLAVSFVVRTRSMQAWWTVFPPWMTWSHAWPQILPSSPNAARRCLRWAIRPQAPVLRPKTQPLNVR